MVRRRYPKFFDQVPSRTMLDYAEAQEEKKFLPKPVKAKKKKFVPCEKCELYSPKPNGAFGCKRTGLCIHL